MGLRSAVTGAPIGRSGNDATKRRAIAGSLAVFTSLTIAGIFAFAAPAMAQTAAATTPAPGGDHWPMLKIAPKGGYLDPKTVPDTVLILPPVPKEGSPQAAADKIVYNETRALKGSTRWKLAAVDALNYLGAYDCALGVRLTQETTPRTLELLRRTGVDASKITNLAKDHYRRPRPFVGSSDPICVEEQRTGLAGSASYPSGHATFGWSVALILAEAAPDRASDILARARSFAESRVVCGVHNLSDVQMGMVAGSVLVAALHADAVFATDLAAAKAELAAARNAPGGAPPEPAMCAVQSDAEAHTPWDNPTTAK